MVRYAASANGARPYRLAGPHTLDLRRDPPIHLSCEALDIRRAAGTTIRNPIKGRP